MSPQPDDFQSSLIEVRKARQQAETLRDQLAAELHHVQEDLENIVPAHQQERFRQGQEAMRKAILAANHAIASIDQALRQMERATDD